jgi:hypothetical protein
MPEPPTEWSPWKHLLYKFVLPMVAALALYVLSIGPMFWVWYASFNDLHLDSTPWPTIFYLPLLFACENEVIRNVVNWYINLWIL